MIIKNYGLWSFPIVIVLGLSMSNVKASSFWESLLNQANTPSLKPWSLSKHEDFVAGLKRQYHYVSKKYKPNQTFSSTVGTVYAKDMKKTLVELQKWMINAKGQNLNEAFNLYPIGDNSKKDIRFTGYYTPVLKAAYSQKKEYKYPLYRSTKKAYRLSRQQIIRGALNNQRLELAWTTDPVANYYMQLQGSGYVEFANGKRVLLQYHSKNNHPYRSIAGYIRKKGYLKQLSNKNVIHWLQHNPHKVNEVLGADPSYLFFEKGSGKPKGASNIELTPEHSIAVDSRKIPLGSVLLAEVPVLKENQTVDYEWRILLAQDRGIAIKGAKHIDLYQGIGKKAGQVASDLFHQGRLFLLMTTTQKSIKLPTALPLTENRKNQQKPPKPYWEQL